MRLFLLLSIILLNFLPLNITLLTAESCEDLVLTSNQKVTISEPKILCKITMQDDSQLTIENVAELKVLGNIELKDNSQLLINNSTISINSNLSLESNSQIQIVKSNVTFYTLKFLLKGNSSAYINFSLFNSEKLEIIPKDLSKLRIRYTSFIGKIYIYPYSYSDVQIEKSHGFKLVISNQRFNATIEDSTLAIKLEIISANPLEIKVPKGLYSYWDPSMISSSMITPAQIKIYRSLFGPTGLNNEIALISRTSVRITNSSDISIALFDIQDNISGLFRGYYDKKTLKISDTYYIELIQSSVITWSLNFQALQSIKITNSSNLEINAQNKTNVEVFNVRNIEQIEIKDNAVILLNESSIIGKVILKDNAKLIAKNTYISNINNIITNDNSIALIASIDEVRTNVKGNTTSFSVYGAIAVLSSSNVTIKNFQLKISLVTKYPKFQTVLIGFENKIGEITFFSLNNLPSAEYKLILEVEATTGERLIAEKLITIKTPIKLSKPTPPSLKITLSGYPILTWEEENNPFIPILGYNIYRGEDPTNLQQIATLSANRTVFIDLNVTQGKEYYYAITAFNELGESEFSNIIQAKLLIKESESEQFVMYKWIPAIAVVTFFMFLSGYIIKSIKNRKSLKH